METIYDQARNHRYRVTLELDVLGDFEPNNINWEKLYYNSAEREQIEHIPGACMGR